MNPSELFTVANWFALGAWLFLLTGARWLPRTFGIVRVVVPVVLALAYLFSLLRTGPVEGGGFSTLEGVAALFGNDWGLLAGWIHYLAFDFFVGCWIVSSSLREGIPHWIIVVPLLFTFLLGPVGLLLFLIVLGFRRSRTAQ